MKINSIWVFLLVWSLSTLACEDVFVTDLRGKEPILLAPADSTITAPRTQTFWWEPCPGATDYRLQIVAPAFAGAQTLQLDTLLTGTRFELFLLAGTYEWQVIASNEVYQQASVQRRLFVVDTAVDLSTLVLQLNSPAENTITNQTSLDFSWEPLPTIEQYRLEITGGLPPATIFSGIVPTAFATVDVLEEGQYFWRVRGENEETFSFTPWAGGEFQIDLQAPAAPVLILPQSGDTIALTLEDPDLSWTGPADAARYDLYLYADAQGQQLVLEMTSETTELNLLPAQLGLDDPAEIGAYFLKVQAVDLAGNISAEDDLLLFFARL